jgi:DNA-directed RNA polymerase subunit RPC12/RpoP
MSLVQRLAAKLSPNAEAESKTWRFTCPECKAESNAWDLGWVITGTRSKGHTRKVRCPKCDAKVQITLEKRQP